MANVDRALRSFKPVSSQAPYQPLALPLTPLNLDRYNEQYPSYPFSALALHYALMESPEYRHEEPPFMLPHPSLSDISEEDWLEERGDPSSPRGKLQGVKLRCIRLSSSLVDIARSVVHKFRRVKSGDRVDLLD